MTMGRFFFFLFCFFPNLIIGQVYDSSIYIDNRSPVNTGTNMTIAIMDMPIYFSSGDTIFSLFKTEEYSYSVAGMTIWKGERLAIALWGDDTMSNVKDGFSDSEPIYWAFKREELYILLEPYYRQGENYFKVNGLAIIDSLTIFK